jgi:hypothetical protein
MKLGKNIFISYRTNPLSPSELGNCISSNRNICDGRSDLYKKCNVVNCSYRQCRLLSDRLKEEKLIQGSIIFPPASLLPQDALISPGDFMKLMKSIDERILDTDAFVRYNLNISGDSYWTNLEKEMWRRHTNKPEMYQIDKNDQQYSINGPITLEPMSNNNKTLWARIKVYIEPEPLSSGHFWGRYSRSTGVVQCKSCGFVFLISRKAVRYLIANNEYTNCPCCGLGSFHFQTKPFYNSDVKFEKKWDLFYKCSTEKPNPNLPAIDIDRMIDVLLDNTKGAPKQLPLACMTDERFPTDTELTLDVMVPPVGIAKATLRFIGKTLSNKNSKLVIRYWDEESHYKEISW